MNKTGRNHFVIFLSEFNALVLLFLRAKVKTFGVSAKGLFVFLTLEGVNTYFLSVAGVWAGGEKTRRKRGFFVCPWLPACASAGGGVSLPSAWLPLYGLRTLVRRGFAGWPLPFGRYRL